MKEDNYYQILEVDKRANQEEIKNAYYKLGKKSHPDVNCDKDASEDFKKIKEAYEILSDKKKRQEYDMQFTQNQDENDINVFKVELFAAPTCPYCPTAKDIVIEAKKQLQNKMDVEEVNIMENKKRANTYGVMAVPAIVINGVVEFVGAPTLDDLLLKLNKLPVSEKNLVNVKMGSIKQIILK
jgi:small redox-active disulfide protein 1